VRHKVFVLVWDLFNFFNQAAGKRAMREKTSFCVFPSFYCAPFLGWSVFAVDLRPNRRIAPHENASCFAIGATFVPLLHR
jgi:hypothetical protein